MQHWIHVIEGTGAWAPWIFVGIFVLASLLTIWRLESMSAGGLDGTVLGTLVTPYMTGMGNLMFAYVLARQHGSASKVMESCLVNNVTNMTIILGAPAIFWSMDILAVKKAAARKPAAAKKTPGNTHEVNRLSLLLTLTAILFFTGLTWVLGGDGRIDRTDGIVLVGVFLFWQSFHVFEVLKHNAQRNRGFNWLLPFDLALFGIGAYAIYISTDWLVAWLNNIHTGFISEKNMGWLSGWLNVLPNGLLAAYYGWTRRPEVVYTSQVGDAHICIPLCVGVFALFEPMPIPSFFTMGVVILLAATLVHFFYIAAFGRLPRYAGWLLVAAGVWFTWRGLAQ